MASKTAYSQRFAHGATTDPGTTRAEIERALKRFGATGFAFATEGLRASVMFEHNSRRIRFDLPDAGTTLKPYVSYATDKDLVAEHKRLWRSLLMAIKAKLEIVASGITSFEVEFLPYVMLDARRTFADAAAEPGFAAALHSGKLPPMLPP